MRDIAILGSSGSIGQQTLEVIKQHSDKFKLTALAVRSNVAKLEEQIKEFNPAAVAVVDAKVAKAISQKFPELKIFSGKNALVDLVQLPEIDIAVVAVTGAAGILPTLKAIERGKEISLANKETLVVAGDLINEALKKNNSQQTTTSRGSLPKGTPALYRTTSESPSGDSDGACAYLRPPIDSEHSAIFQCLNGEDKKNIKKIILTCSGGAFKNYSKEELKEATAKDALNHPTWKMGAKITIDCATLMNKGFEIIEAHQLFGLPYEKIEVIIHPESKIHSMVEFIDGSIMAQIGAPDMRIPIQYSLSYPERLENNFERLNFNKLPHDKGGKGGLSLTFRQPNIELFPCLKYAIEAGQTGGTMPAVLNAANEICVQKFLENKIKFLDIAKIIKQAMDEHQVIKNPTLEQILETDKWARDYAQSVS